MGSSSIVADRHHGQGRSGSTGSWSITNLVGSRAAAVLNKIAVEITNKSRLLRGPRATIDGNPALGKDFAFSVASIQ